jgi:uncharacterized protein YjeT (DUF2065 family)
MLEEVLFIIGLLIAFEGLFVAFFPKKTKLLMTRLGKNVKRLKWIGVIELIIGLVILSIAVLNWS